MNGRLYDILNKWLREAGYQINWEQFEISLLSHPDYDGLTAVTDTLNEFGIENTAAHVPLETLELLTEPFIAHIKQGHQERLALVHPISIEKVKLYVGDKKEEYISVIDFKEVWTGAIVAIEKNAYTGKRTLHCEEKHLMAVLTILISTIFLLGNPTVHSGMYFGLSLMGLYISGVIIAHQLGAGNNFVSRFCTLGKNTSCDSVLNSKYAKLTNSIGLSDICVVYFASQVLSCLAAGKYSSQMSSIWIVISLCGMVFIGWSLYLQKFII